MRTRLDPHPGWLRVRAEKRATPRSRPEAKATEPAGNARNDGRSRQVGVDKLRCGHGFVLKPKCYLRNTYM